MNGFKKPTVDQYKSVLAYAAKRGKITTKLELAMFLGNSIQETGGLAIIGEKPSLTGADPKQYDNSDWGTKHTPAPGKSGQYYGRGYLQLSYPANYMSASEALYGAGNDKLWKNPELVSSDQSVAWETAFWFWGAIVHDQAQGGKFGQSVMAINSWECSSGPTEAGNRLKYYRKVLEAFGLKDKADTSGCGTIAGK